MGIGTAAPTTNLEVKGTHSAGDKDYAIIWNENGAGVNDLTSLAFLHGGGKRTSRISSTLESSSATSLVFSTDNSGVSEKMRLDSSGNVGINKADPSSISASANTLTIRGGVTSKAGAIRLESSDASVDGYIYPDATSGFSIGSLSNHPMSLRTNSTTRMTIDSSGLVGIGTASPSTELHVLAANPTIRMQSSGAGTNTILSFLSRNDSNVAAYANIIADGAGHTSEFAPLRFTQGPAATERMRIDSSGNVGIGETNPTGERLCITGNATSTSGIRMRRTDVGTGSGSDGFINIADTGELSLYRGSEGGSGVSRNIRINAAATDGNIVFNTSGVSGENMRLDSSGNLLVGTTSNDPNTRGFDVRTSISTAAFVAGLGINAHQTATTTCASFSNANGQVGAITTSGSATAYATSSDVRLKDNIVDAPAGNIDSIKVRSFDWKADGSHQDYGFIAQELETVAPYAVSKGETEEDMWSVDYSKLVPMLVKEIQELKAEVEALKNA